MVPDNNIAANIFYWKDLKTMASSTGLAGARLVPFFIDADRRPGSRTLPVGGVTVVDLPNNHLQYAITWYGLAVVLLLVTGTAVYRRWTGAGEDEGLRRRSPLTPGRWPLSIRPQTSESETDRTDDETAADDSPVRARAAFAPGSTGRSRLLFWR